MRARADQQRSTVVDMAKGVAIILVVYGHCLRGIVAAGIVPQASPLIVTDYVVYTFHMPIFFFLSGLFAVGVRRRTRVAFVLGLLQNIVYPYFLWSTVQSSIQILLAGSGAINGSMDIHRLLQIWYRPVAPFWFLYALFFCRLMAYALARVSPRALFASSALALALVDIVAGAGVLQDVAYGLTYFSLGMMAQADGWTAAARLRPTATSALVAAFLVAAIGCYMAGIPERLPIPATLLGIAATIAVCDSIDRRRDSFAGRLLALLGRYSMSIFVMHILVLACVRTVFLRMLHVSSVVIIMPVAIVAALALPMLVQAILVRWGLNDLAGLPFSARRGAPAPVLGGNDRPPGSRTKPLSASVRESP